MWIAKTDLKCLVELFFHNNSNKNEFIKIGREESFTCHSPYVYISKKNRYIRGPMKELADFLYT